MKKYLKEMPLLPILFFIIMGISGSIYNKLYSTETKLNNTNINNTNIAAIQATDPVINTDISLKLLELLEKQIAVQNKNIIKLIETIAAKQENTFSPELEEEDKKQLESNFSYLFKTFKKIFKFALNTCDFLTSKKVIVAELLTITPIILSAYYFYPSFIIDLTDKFKNLIFSAFFLKTHYEINYNDAESMGKFSATIYNIIPLLRTKACDAGIFITEIPGKIGSKFSDLFTAETAKNLLKIFYLTKAGAVK